MKICKCCGQQLPEQPIPPESPLYIIVRKKKIGFAGKLSDSQLRYWESLGCLHTSLKEMVNYFHCSNDCVYECKFIGFSEDIRNNMKDTKND